MTMVGGTVVYRSTVSPYVASNAIVRRSVFISQHFTTGPDLAHGGTPVTRSAFAFYIPGDGRSLPSPAAPVHAQPPEAASRPQPAVGDHNAPPPASDDDDAAAIRPSPTSSSINLPTTLPLPRHKGELSPDAIGSTGTCGTAASADQLSNFFGLDVGANIGLEFRFGVMQTPRSDRAAHHIAPARFSSPRKYDAWHQTDDVAGLASPASCRLRATTTSREQRERAKQLRAGARRRDFPRGRHAARAVRDALLGRQHRHRRATRTATPASSDLAAASGSALTRRPISAPKSRRGSAGWSSGIRNTDSRSRNASARTSSR